MDDDDELITAIAAGDDTALRELFSRHAPWLAIRLRSLLPATDTEDVLQETFLAVWQGASGYRPGSAGGWLWGIARRQAALFLRRRGPAPLGLPRLLAIHDSDGDPADAALSGGVIGRAARPSLRGPVSSGRGRPRHWDRTAARSVRSGGWSTSRTGGSRRRRSCWGWRWARGRAAATG